MHSADLHLKLSPDSKNWLEETAGNTDRTVSAIVRAAIDFYRKGYHLALSIPEGAPDISQLLVLQEGLTKALEAQNRALDDLLKTKRA